MKLVYYSLALQDRSPLENQWLQSIRGLRRYNQKIAVHLVVYGGVPSRIRSEADRSEVVVHELADYAEYLSGISEKGSILAKYRTFHKFLSLGHLPTQGLSQILYLDCDTFFFDDVGKLFQFYSSCDWYAREEPYSRQSHLGYDPAYLDETALECAARKEGLAQVLPFNTGVCLLNNGVWDRLQQLQSTYLDFAWRLFAGMDLNAPVALKKEAIPAKIGGTTSLGQPPTENDRSRVLKHPSSNPWIIDQVALWMTLGDLRPMSQGFFDRKHVAQNGEIITALENGRGCIVAHYFSNLSLHKPSGTTLASAEGE